LGEHVVSIFRVEQGWLRKRPVEETDKFISANRLLLLASFLAYSSTVKMEVFFRNVWLSPNHSKLQSTDRTFNRQQVSRKWRHRITVQWELWVRYSTDKNRDIVLKTLPVPKDFGSLEFLITGLVFSSLFWGE
jgi:hypothetical protein